MVAWKGKLAHAAGDGPIEGGDRAGPNLFTARGWRRILVLRQRKAKERAGKVLAVDASSPSARAAEFPTPIHAATILGWVRAFGRQWKTGYSP